MPKTQDANYFKILLTVISVLLTIVGWGITSMLSKIDQSIDRATKEIGETKNDLTRFMSSTEILLANHTLRLDKQSVTLEKLRDRRRF